MDWIIQYSEKGKSEFMMNHMVQDAIIREFEILGEAAKRISDKTRNLYPDIPWKKMAGLRDRSIHDYMGLNIELFFDLAKDEIPGLKKRFDQILKDIGDPADQK